MKEGVLFTRSILYQKERENWAILSQYFLSSRIHVLCCSRLILKYYFLWPRLASIGTTSILSIIYSPVIFDLFRQYSDSKR